MKNGDLVMWKWKCKLSPDKIGVILSDTHHKGADGLLMKNVYWADREWIRPIRQEFLEVIND